MLFNEIYGTYYKVVGDILREAIGGKLDQKKLNQIVLDKAFGETLIELPEQIQGDDWQLLDQNFKTPIKNIHLRPLTILEKSWLKAILLDPRIKLFKRNLDELHKSLEDVEPLYEQDAFVYFDRFQDGDPFDDDTYRENFQTILEAFNNHRKLEIRFVSNGGRLNNKVYIPWKLEYSLKDDKFRLLAIYKKALESLRTLEVKSWYL